MQLEAAGRVRDILTSNCTGSTCGLWMTVTTGRCEIISQAKKAISMGGLDVRSRM
jgi:hypothetical protein